MARKNANAWLKRTLPRRFAAIDVEATSKYLNRARIIEVAVVVSPSWNRARIAVRYQSLVFPDRKIDTKASELTGLKDADLVAAPRIWEVLPRIKNAIGDLPLVAHNAVFDRTLLQRAADACGIAFDYDWFDTLWIARAYLPGLSSYTLESVARHLNLAWPKDMSSHRAAADARMAAELFMDFVEMQREV